MSASYKDEPGFLDATDYMNEPLGLCWQIADVLRDRGLKSNLLKLSAGTFGIGIEDSVLCEAIASARQKMGKLPTLQQKYFDPEDPSRLVGDMERQIAEDMRRSPLRARRLDELVDIVNTTSDLPQFMSAINEMYMVAYKKDSGPFALTSRDGEGPRRPGAIIPTLPKPGVPSAP